VTHLAIFLLLMQPQPSATGSISGHVYRADTRAGIAKATVVLNPQDDSPGAQRRVSITDASGAFMFNDVAPARYAIEAERSGFITQYQSFPPGKALELHPGQQISGLNCLLTEASVVSGVVKDEDGDPVPSLRVLALMPTYLRGGKLQLSVYAAEITDDRGQFRFHALKPGAYYFRVGGIFQQPMGELPPLQEAGHGKQYRDTWLQETSPMHVSAGSNINVGEMRVQLEDTWTVTGKIEGSAPDGAKPTEVRALKDQPFEETFSWGGNVSVIRPDGTFAIQGLPAGDYTLTATGDANGKQIRAGYASVRIADKNVTANIPLGEAAAVQGQVTGQPGTQKVSAEPINEQGFYVAEISPNGDFAVPNLPPGTYTIGLSDTGLSYPREISCAGTDYTHSTFTLSMGSILGDCKITLSSDFGTISGTLKKGDDPQPDMLIALIPQSSDLRRFRRYTLTASTDQSGHYQISHVISGDYFLFALQPNDEHRWFARDFADTHQGAATAVTIQPGQSRHSDLKIF